MGCLPFVERAALGIAGVVIYAIGFAVGISISIYRSARSLCERLR